MAAAQKTQAWPVGNSKKRKKKRNRKRKKLKQRVETREGRKLCSTSVREQTRRGTPRRMLKKSRSYNYWAKGKEGGKALSPAERKTGEVGKLGGCEARYSYSWASFFAKNKKKGEEEGKHRAESAAQKNSPIGRTMATDGSIKKRAKE